MIRSGLLSLFFVVASTSWAQVVLVQPEVPPAGFAADLLADVYIAPSAPSDVAQAWDFSDVGGNAIGLQEVLPASSSSLASAFDGAEWVNSSGEQMAFWRWEAGSMAILGNANATNFITIPFNDPLTQWAFPLSFGDVHEDTFSCEVTLFGLPYSLEGTVNTEVDAFGSLTLPNGTYLPEVLRAHYVQSYTETYDGDTAVWTLVQHQYLAPDSVLPVFYQEELVVSDLVGNVLAEVTDVAWFDNTVVEVMEHDGATAIPVSPNPIREGETAIWNVTPGQRWQAVARDGRVLDRGVAGADGRVELQTGGWSGLILLVPMPASGRAANGVQRLIVKGC